MALRLSVTAVVGLTVPGGITSVVVTTQVWGGMMELLALSLTVNVTVPALAEGIVRVANANMERAIRVVSVERGHDPRRFALLAFGGAGGMHACEIAAELEIGTAIVPRHAGVLSALGMLVADVTRDYSASVLRRSDAMSPAAVTKRFGPLVGQAARELAFGATP